MSLKKGSIEMFRLWAMGVCLMCVASIWAGPLYHFDSVKKQERFNALLTQYRCLVCQNQTLLDSDAGFAQDIKARLYAQLQSGASDQMVREDLLKRYGPAIAMVPPKQGVHWLLWTAPVWLVVCFLGVLRRR